MNENEYVEAAEAAEEQENVGGTAADGVDSGAIESDGGSETSDPSAEAEERVFSDKDTEDGGKGTAEEDGKPDKSDADKADKPERREQTPEERRENARRRREQENRQALAAAEQKGRREARMEAILEVTGGVNPYTGEPMKDVQDVEVYERMRRIERGGGDPVKDYAKATADEARRAEATRAEAETDARWYRDDLAAFRRAYPDVDAEALLSDPDFNDYAKAQVKAKVPLSDIYGGYRRLEAKFSKAAEEKARAAESRAAQALANARAGVGGKSGESAAEGSFFTKEQVEAMSPSEISRHLEAIQKSMRKW